MTVDTSPADFLRACRGRLRPEDVGLPDDGRPRRVPGLRREEVARLASVSVDYLVRLEQGRTTRVSRAVLESLAEALRLRPDERDYLLAVADNDGGRRRAAAPESRRVRPPARRLPANLHEIPALVVGRGLDVLAWNPAASALLADFASLAEDERNVIRLTFLDPSFRDLYDDWRKIARECVAYLRMEAARYPDDPRLVTLVGELSLRDADFRTWWAGHRVARAAFARKSFRHPVAGPMTLDPQRFAVEGETDQHLIIYTAESGSPSHEALRFLAGWAPAAGDERAPRP